MTATPDRTEIGPGEPVWVTVEAVNTSDTDGFRYWSGQPLANLLLFDGRGTPIWTNTMGRIYPASVKEVTLAPGEKRTARVAWDRSACPPYEDRPHEGPKAPPGVYWVIGMWQRWEAPPFAVTIR